MRSEAASSRSPGPLACDTRTLPEEAWNDATRGHVSFRTVFGDGSPTDTFTAGVAELRPHGWLARHRHAQAEIYFLTEGHGIVTLDGVDSHVAAGMAVFIPADHEHGIRNDGPDVLRFFYAFAADSMDDVEYRFSAPPTPPPPTP